MQYVAERVGESLQSVLLVALDQVVQFVPPSIHPLLASLHADFGNGERQYLAFATQRYVPDFLQLRKDLLRFDAERKIAVRLPRQKRYAPNKSVGQTRGIARY